MTNDPMSPSGPDNPLIKDAGRRPRGRVLMLVGAIAGVAAAAFIYTVYQRQQSMAQPSQSGADQLERVAGATAPDDLFNQTPEPTPAAPQAVPAAPQATPTAQPASQLQEPAQQLQQPRELTQAERDRQRVVQEALNASPVVQSFGTPEAPRQIAQRQQQQFAPVPTPTLVPPLQVGSGAPDPNRQAEKTAFLERDPATDVYLNAKREAPRSRTELKAGTVIPAVMIGGINSDLPGQIVGQVSRNVYDTRSGRVLLIPAGAKVVGVYDSQVTNGQSRVLVAWERIIFPDGSSISLGAMPGTDQGGYAGFRDKVDRHTFRIFKDALLLSVISAGAQLSQPRNSDGDLNASQIATAALGQQFSQVGAEMIRRNMNTQPTLKIRPGYQFNVMITKDVILPPWRG